MVIKTSWDRSKNKLARLGCTGPKNQMFSFTPCSTYNGSFRGEKVNRPPQAK